MPADIGNVRAWSVREGITNAIRHSRARRCVIHLATGDDGVELTIRDDGRGRQRAIAEASSSSGHGLAGVAERAEALGGHVESGPSPTGGFCLAVWLPVGERPPAPANAPLAATQPARP